MQIWKQIIPTNPQIYFNFDLRFCEILHHCFSNASGYIGVGSWMKLGNCLTYYIVSYNELCTHFEVPSILFRSVCSRSIQYKELLELEINVDVFADLLTSTKTTILWIHTDNEWIKCNIIKRRCKHGDYSN